MRTIKFTFFLTLLILGSCKPVTKFDQGDISFSFNSEISRENQELIAEMILLQIDEFDFEELDLIEKIKIDTIPYSFVFNIPYGDSITESTIDRFKGFAAVLSEFKLGGVPVHISLTDNDFEPIQNLEFDKTAYQTTGDYFKSKNIKMTIDSSMPKFQPGGLSIVLLNEIPSMFLTKDTVLLNLKMENNDIKADFIINFNEVPIETLKNEFGATDPLYFYGLFDNKTIYFQIRDKKDSELKIVFIMEKV